MSAFTKMMGWDQIKEDASMMKGQGDELMTMGSGMYDRGSDFLSGKGDWYDNAMSTFMRNQRDTQGQAGRNVMRGFASKGAGGGFAGLINANMNSAQRLGEGSSGFFSNLYQKGADMGVRLQTGAQGYTGQANQAYSKGADLSKARSDISTGLLNSAIGLGGGLLMQNMANKGALGIAETMMGGAGQATAAVSSSGGGGKGLMKTLGSVAPSLLGGSGRSSTMASGLMGMKSTTPYGPPKPSMTYQNIPANQRSNYNRFAPSVSSMLQSGMLGGEAGARGPSHMYDGYNQGVNSNNQWNEFADPYHPRNFQGDYYFGDSN
jgi:hypothetical protein